MEFDGLVLKAVGLRRLAVIAVMEMEPSGGDDVGHEPRHDNEKEERHQRQEHQDDVSNDSTF